MKNLKAGTVKGINRALLRQEQREAEQAQARQAAEQRQAEARRIQEAYRIRQQVESLPLPKDIETVVATEITRANGGVALHKRLRREKPLLPQPASPLNNLAAQAVLNIHERVQTHARPVTARLRQEIVKTETVRLWRNGQYIKQLKKGGLAGVEVQRLQQQVARERPEAGALHQQVQLERALYRDGHYSSTPQGRPKTGLAGQVVTAFEQLAGDRAGFRQLTFAQIENKALELWRAERLKSLLAEQGLSRVVVEPSAPKPEAVAPVKVRLLREKKAKPASTVADTRPTSPNRRSEGFPSQTVLRRYATELIARHQFIKADQCGPVMPVTGRIASVVAEAVVAVDGEVTQHNKALMEAQERSRREAEQKRIQKEKAAQEKAAKAKTQPSQSPLSPATPKAPEPPPELPPVVLRCLSTGAVIERTMTMLRQQRLSEKVEPVRVPVAKTVRPLAKKEKQKPAETAAARDNRRLKRDQRQAEEPVLTAAQTFNKLGRTLRKQAEGLPLLMQSLRNHPEGVVSAKAIEKSLELAQYLEQQGAPQRALSLLSMLAQKTPGNGDVLLQLAFTRRATGNIPAALRTFDAVMDMPGMRVPALAGLAQTYLHTGRPGQALTVLEKHAPTEPVATLEQLRQTAEADLSALAAAKAQRRPRARKAEAALPAVEPETPVTSGAAPHTRRAVYSFNLISRSSGLDTLITRAMNLGAGVQALNTIPDEELATQPKALQSRGDLYLAEGETRRALKSYHRAIALVPDNIALRLSAAEAAQEEGDFAASSQHLHHVLGLQPRMLKARALLAAGDMLQAHQQGQGEVLNAAKATLAKIQTAAPHRADLLALRSRTLFATGDYTGAIALEAATQPQMEPLLAHARSQHDLEQVGTVFANAGLARLMLVEGLPKREQELSCREATTSFTCAKEVMGGFHPACRPKIPGFNVYSQNLLIKLTTLQIEAANRGGLGQSHKAALQTDLDNLKASRAAQLAKAQRIVQTVAKVQTMAKNGPQQRMA